AACEISIKRQIPKKGEEGDAGRKNGIGRRIPTVRNLVEKRAPLLLRALAEGFSKSLMASHVQPQQTTRQLPLVVRIFPGEQIDELGNSCLDCATAAAIGRHNHLHQRSQKLVLLGTKEYRRFG